MTDFTFTAYMNPRGKARPRLSPNGRVFNPSENTKAERDIAEAYKNARGYTRPGLLTRDDFKSIYVRAYFALPKTASEEDEQRAMDGSYRPLKRPDADNILKLVMDGLNGLAYEDDARVVKATCEKFYTPAEPRIEITLSR